MSDRPSSESGHHFGGAWTEQKLQVIRDYLHAYTTALRDKPTSRSPFELWYIDAFAGTGYRTERGKETEAPVESTSAGRQRDLFIDPDATALRKGSAAIAVEVTPPFRRFVFIEKSRARCKALEGLRSAHPLISASIEIRRGDANEEIGKITAENWRHRRAVVFLDPYATSVRWSTLEAIAGTRAMDTWILFPLMALNRMLRRDADLPLSWVARFDRIMGTNEWRERLYQTRTSRGLFGNTQTEIVKAKIEAIGRFFIERLQGVFAGVSTEPMILGTTPSNPLFMLCFAAGNPKGAPIALRIANHLLERDLR